MFEMQVIRYLTGSAAILTPLLIKFFILVPKLSYVPKVSPPGFGCNFYDLGVGNI